MLFDFPDVPNWRMEDNSVLNKKTIRDFFSSSPCDWGELIWSSSIPPTKSLVLWKIIDKRLPTSNEVQKRGVVLCSILCALCAWSKRRVLTIYFLVVLLFILFGLGFRIFFLILIIIHVLVY